MPLISVALPVYNGANFLREALESIVVQQFEDFELVISDNHSTDETPAIIQDFASRDRRIRASRADTFLSQQTNANRSVELCTGTWIKLFCHDDVMRPDCLSVLRDALGTADAANVGLIGNGEAWLFENGYCWEGPPVQEAPSASIHPGHAFARCVLSGGARVPLPSFTTATVRKEAWNRAGQFDPRFMHFDLYCWMRVLVDWNYRYVPHVLTINRIHGAQLATGARKSQRSVSDQREFWPEFVRENRKRVGFGWSSFVQARLKAVGTAATHIGIELLQGRRSDALRMTNSLPRHWLPVIPLLVARGLHAERKKLRYLTPHVPVELIYPR
jgi:glycosyltransferase involved in cell wall biosynthesis